MKIFSMYRTCAFNRLTLLNVPRFIATMFISLTYAKNLDSIRKVDNAFFAPKHSTYVDDLVTIADCIAFKQNAK